MIDLEKDNNDHDLNGGIQGLEIDETQNYNKIELEEEQLLDKVQEKKNNGDEQLEEEKGILQMIYDNIGGFLFDYHSQQFIYLKDQKIGNFQLVIKMVVLFFVIFFFIIPQQIYLSREESESTVYLKLFGNSYANIKSKLYLWDNSNNEFSNSGVNSIFIPTRVKITPNQLRGECPTLDLPCITDKNCIEQEFPNIMELDLCEETVEVFDHQNMTNSIKLKGCLANQWCPNENSLMQSTMVSDLVGQTHKRVFFRSSVDFPILGGDIRYSNYMDNQLIEYPAFGSNVISLKDILNLANVDYEEVRFYGCIIVVKLIWNCDLDSLNQCQPSILAEKLDTIDNRGYAIRHSIYSLEKLEHRTIKNYQGVQLKFISKAIATKFTLEQFFIVLLILVGMQAFIDQFIAVFILKIFGEKKHYSSQIITKLRNKQLT